MVVFSLSCLSDSLGAVDCSSCVWAVPRIGSAKCYTLCLRVIVWQSWDAKKLTRRWSDIWRWHVKPLGIGSFYIRIGSSGLFWDSHHGGWDLRVCTSPQVRHTAVTGTLFKNTMQNQDPLRWKPRLASVLQVQFQKHIIAECGARPCIKGVIFFEDIETVGLLSRILPEGTGTVRELLGIIWLSQGQDLAWWCEPRTQGVSCNSIVSFGTSHWHVW